MLLTVYQVKLVFADSTVREYRKTGSVKTPTEQKPDRKVS